MIQLVKGFQAPPYGTLVTSTPVSKSGKKKGDRDEHYHTVLLRIMVLALIATILLLLSSTIFMLADTSVHGIIAVSFAQPFKFCVVCSEVLFQHYIQKYVDEKGISA